MSRSDRLYRLLALLRRRRIATAAELAEHLQVSERTIYRDVQQLVDNGVEIRGEAGVGYRLEKGGALPPIMLDVEEVQALVFGARLVDRWGDPDLRAAAKSALDKLSAVLPPAQESWLDNTALYTIPSRPTRADQDKLALVRDALSQRRCLETDYVDRQGASSTRVLYPLGLWFWTSTWTLAAWCGLRQDYRSFRVDRLDQLRMSEQRFPNEEPYTVKSFVDAMRAREGVNLGTQG